MRELMKQDMARTVARVLTADKAQMEVVATFLVAPLLYYRSFRAFSHGDFIGALAASRPLGNA